MENAQELYVILLEQTPENFTYIKSKGVLGTWYKADQDCTVTILIGTEVAELPADLPEGAITFTHEECCNPEGDYQRCYVKR